MQKTICELFAGVGGFRCGLNHIKKTTVSKKEKWETVWFNQWEPADKRTQWAHGCYVSHFGVCPDLRGRNTTNMDIHAVDKNDIPDFNLLVGGFPCLAGDTLVTTDHGDVSLKDILVNDMVLSHDGEFHKVIGYYDRGIKETFLICGEGFQPIVATSNHKFYVKIKDALPGWISVEEIRKHPIGSVCFARLSSRGFDWIPLELITENGEEHVYDITVEDTHSFIANGIVTHNCQDYSVASSLRSSRGIEGKKGVLWWDIRDVLEAKNPPFVLLENVDRFLKSPAKQRGRDFAIILACFRDLGYVVEWRVINAADYGLQQRRRRVFIFACKKDTNYAKTHYDSPDENALRGGFFAQAFPAKFCDGADCQLPNEVGTVSDSFSFPFETGGIMKDGLVYTAKAIPTYSGKQTVIGDILESGDVPSSLFIPLEKLYYRSDKATHCDETFSRLSEKDRGTWQYIKGAKKYWRKSANGHEYIYSEGCMPMIDESDKPARTLLTSEGSFGRSTHLVRDKKTGDIRLLTAKECERIQGFPDDWTKQCLANGELIEVSEKKRKFMMGNALVVDLVSMMERELSKAVEAES